MAGSVGEFRCEVCEVQFAWKSKYERHLAGAKHCELSSMILSSTNQDYFSEQLDIDVVDDSGSLSPVVSPIQHEIEDDPVDSATDASETCGDCTEDMMSVSTNSDDFTPFPTKMFTLLYLLIHSPRPMGESNLKFIWHVFRQFHYNMPSLATVKSFVLPGYSPPHKYYSSTGEPFYVIKPSDVLQLCLENPEISAKLQRYPVKSSGVCGEMYQGQRWWSDPKFQAPMVSTPHGHIYVGDFVKFSHPRLKVAWGKLEKFFMKDTCGTIFVKVLVLLDVYQIGVECHNVSTIYTDPDSFLVHGSEEITVGNILRRIDPPSILLHLDESTRCLHQFTLCEYRDFIQPNPLRSVARDLPIVIVPLKIYTDDLSGNKSKKWNKFDCFTLMLAGLSKNENNKLHSIHFLTCSNTVSVLDMVSPIVDDLLCLEKGIELFDAYQGERVLAIAPVICFQSDNPRAAELLNHQGSNANLYCRVCTTNKHNDPTQIAALRNKTTSMQQMDAIRNSPTESQKAKLRAEFGLKESANPILHLSIDPYSSTPTETLHTILLGPYKYLLKDLIRGLSSSEKPKFLALVSAFEPSGFTTQITGNIIYHHKSFVGRDYKAWAQMAPFIVRHFVSDSEKDMWLCLSKVFWIAYCRPYCHDHYTENKKICQDFVESVKTNRPAMMNKSKIHLLLHLADHMLDFGPTSSYSTERCESFNGLMRMQNIYSNRHAPSRDVAIRFSVLNYIRYICSGGSFDGDKKCGDGLKVFFSSTPVQHFINGTAVKELDFQKAIYQPGTLRKKQKLTKLGNVSLFLRSGIVPLANVSQAYDLHFPPHLMDLNAPAWEYSGVMTENLQLVNFGNFVKVDHIKMNYGLYLASVVLKEEQERYCFIQELESVACNGEVVVNEFDCPILTLTGHIYALNPRQLITSVSVVHECTSSCVFVEKHSPSFRERECVSKKSLVYEHDLSNDMYCLNIFCINQ